MAGSEGILISIAKTKGSTPRDVGAKLWVSANDLIGSIGGGRLEEGAISHARQMLESGQLHDHQTIILGPELGQCCGGQIDLEYQHAQRPEQPSKHLAIFGAGHVGSQLFFLSQTLAFQTRLIDNRPKIELPQPAPYELITQPVQEINKLPSQTHLVILTHDHALDFRLAERALLRDDLGFIGMIGSASKAARFRSQFSALGERLQVLNSPINKSSQDKRPESIALTVLSEILEKTHIFF